MAMEIGTITGAQNPRVKRARSLKNKKERKLSGCFLAEGFKSVSDAAAAGADIEEVFVEEGKVDQLCALPETVRVYAVPGGILSSICDTQSPQGVAAVIRRIGRALWETPEALTGNLLIGDDIQDPGNLGTLIRTADAAGCSGVILSGDSVECENPKVIRATMGSYFHIPVFRTDDLPATLTRLLAEGYRVMAGDLHGTPYYKRKLDTSKKALVIGNEAHGIREAVLAAVPERYRLPILGRAESLNAAMAAGIMLYDLVREEEERK